MLLPRVLSGIGPGKAAGKGDGVEDVVVGCEQKQFKQ